MNNMPKKDGMFSTTGSLVDDFFNQSLFNWTGRGSSSVRNSIPSANIEETDKLYCIDLAVPGMKKSDFRIELNNHVLSVQTEREDEEQQTYDGTFKRREFSYQSFYRTFRLPEWVDVDTINATYNDGILRIEVEKKSGDSSRECKLISVE